MNIQTKSNSKLSKEVIVDVIKHCNNGIVPDAKYNCNRQQFESAWFEDYFNFIDETGLRTQLGDAFYQARFMYKIMSNLKLSLAKYKGIVKFQILQYASICEAVLDYTISKFFKDEAETFFAVNELKKDGNALASDVKISKSGKTLYLCYEKTNKGILKRTRADHKSKFAVDKGIISEAIKCRFDQLYDLRNNIHILKAAETGYIPKLKEAKEAFLLMQEFVDSVKDFFKNHTEV